jgi:hypothetical protein
MTHHPSNQNAEVTGIAAGAMAGATQGARAAVSAADEHAYWRTHFRDLPALGESASYESFAAAFEFGWQQQHRHAEREQPAGASFATSEPALAAEWQRQPAAALLAWEMARHAAKAAWERVEAAVAGDPKPSAR